jgi:cytoskeleton protein RodZ
MDNEIASAENVNNMTHVNESIKISGLGARLKSAREAMNLSEKEAAGRLYLNVKIISFIENEHFSDGPPMTFMRGYLRSYAKLLNVPDTEINAALEEIELAIPDIKPEAPILHATPIRQSERYLKWFTLLIVLTLITLVCIWWNSQSHYLNDISAKTPFQPTIAPLHKLENTPPPKAWAKPAEAPRPAYGVMIPLQGEVTTKPPAPPVSNNPVDPAMNKNTDNSTP